MPGEDHLDTVCVPRFDLSQPAQALSAAYLIRLQLATRSMNRTSEPLGSIPGQAESLAHLALAQMEMGDLFLAQETLRQAD